MSQDDDIIYKKDLSEEQIRELQEQSKAYRYRQNCITAALLGTVIAFFAALLLGISVGTICILSGLGAVAGYAFYAWGKYLEEKHKDDESLEFTVPDKIDNNEPLKDTTENKPLCPGCLEPIDPLNYYCPKCGEANSPLTPYLPFVNIRFNYSIYGRLWHNLWYKKTSLLMKVISAALIILFVPILVIGLPFVIWDKLSNRKKQDDLASKGKGEKS